MVVTKKIKTNPTINNLPQQIDKNNKSGYNFETYNYDNSIQTLNNTDTSDEEELRNHVGNIPHEWYDSFGHLGYTIEGNKILKKLSTNDSSLSNIDQFLNAHDNPNYWKTITDNTTGKQYILDNEDLQILDSIELGKYPDLHYDPYQEYIDWYTGDLQVTPINCVPESKRSFMPSFSEHKRVMRLVKAIRNGHIKLDKKDDNNKDLQSSTNYYLLWDTPNEELHNNLTKAMRWRQNMHWAAPKLPLPDTSESFNPPPEYLPDNDEIQKWNSTDYDKKIGKVLPQKYECLRHVPAYEHFLREKFERCLDLYLCPRKKKMKIMVDPESLIPKLPSLQELQPFPSWEALRFIGHTSKITSLSISNDGELLASGDNSGNLIIWNISTSRILFNLNLHSDQPISTVSWNKNPKLNKLLMITCGDKTFLLLPLIGSSSITFKTIKDYLINLNNMDENGDTTESHLNSQNNCTNILWSKFEKHTLTNNGSITYYIMVIDQTDMIKISNADWHKAGDYILSVIKHIKNNRYSVIIHQLSKKRSQLPFKKSKPYIREALFHPIKPIIFVATQRKIFVYNLQKQTHLKTYTSNVDWISSIAIHPLGDNFVIGSFDNRICWFDMDLSTTPYKTYKYNKKAIKDVDLHPIYPLWCAASDDGSCTILHSKVYSDLSKDTFIVPIKQLHGEGATNGFTTCKFHPSKAWLFAAASDASIRLFM